MGYTTLREGDKRQAEVGMLHRLDFVVRSIYLVVVRARHSGEGLDRILGCTTGLCYVYYYDKIEEECWQIGRN